MTETAEGMPRTIEIRPCDKCTLCCKLLGVPSLDKPMDRWCGFCHMGRGCGMYEQRPEECRQFFCAWVLGFGGQEDRPDRSNVVVCAPEPSEALGLVMVTVHVNDGYPDAWKQGTTGLRLKTLLDRGWILTVIYRGERSMIAADPNVLRRLTEGT